MKDVARGYLRLAERLEDDRVRGEAFNFSTETPVTVLELVTLLRRLMNACDLEPDIRDCADGEIRSQRLSAAKAREILGWEPRWDLTGGLTETIAWYEAFLGERP